MKLPLNVCLVFYGGLKCLSHIYKKFHSQFAYTSKKVWYKIRDAYDKLYKSTKW
jgi:hypothetical protein